jgi:GT2 family glycosyltransferase
MGKLPLIIATYNRQELLQQTIESAFENADNQLEVIVVNDVSTDKTEEYLDSLTNVKHIDLKERVSIAIVKNTGIKMVEKSEYICVSDNDVYYLPHWDSTLIKVLDTYPDIGVVGGKKHPHHRLIWDPPITLRVLLREGEPLINIRKLNADVNVQLVEQQAGYSLMLRREDMNKLGGFNIALSTSEDNEFCERVMAMGKFIAAVDPPVLHHCGLCTYTGNKSADYPEMMSLQDAFPNIKFR